MVLYGLMEDNQKTIEPSPCLILKPPLVLVVKAIHSADIKTEITKSENI